MFSYGEYEGTLRKLIHAFKYGRVESLAKPLGGMLSQAVPLSLRVDVVIPMPMHWRKRHERGFNQAELLAKPVARRLQLPTSSALAKLRHTAAQASLSDSERQKNLQGSFAVKERSEIRDKHVLLVDDVFTTGSTLRAAATALKAGGARQVSALTVARADRRMAVAEWADAPAA